MTRQRIRPSLKRSVYQDCPHCRGTGQVKTIESMSIDVMRLLATGGSPREHCPGGSSRPRGRGGLPAQSPPSGRPKLEESGKMQVMVEGVPGAPPELLDLVCYDNHNNELRLFPPEAAAPTVTPGAKIVDRPIGNSSSTQVRLDGTFTPRIVRRPPGTRRARLGSVAGRGGDLAHSPMHRWFALALVLALGGAVASIQAQEPFRLVARHCG